MTRGPGGWRPECSRRWPTIRVAPARRGSAGDRCRSSPPGPRRAARGCSRGSGAPVELSAAFDLPAWLGIGMTGAPGIPHSAVRRGSGSRRRRRVHRCSCDDPFRAADRLQPRPQSARVSSDEGPRRARRVRRRGRCSSPAAAHPGMPKQTSSRLARCTRRSQAVPSAATRWPASHSSPRSSRSHGARAPGADSRGPARSEARQSRQQPRSALATAIGPQKIAIAKQPGSPGSAAASPH